MKKIYIIVFITFISIFSCAPQDLEYLKIHYGGIGYSNGRLETLIGCDSNLDSLEFLYHTPDLKNLEIEQGLIKDFSPISTLKSLETLGLYKINNVHIGFLLDLKVIKNLYLFDSNLVGLETLNKLTSLKCLWFVNCSLDSTEYFDNLFGLMELHINLVENLTNISSISHLNSLVKLDITNCPKLSDISAIGTLKNLKYLDLTGCKNVNDISALAGCENLEVLYLMGNDETPKGIEIIKNLKNLKEISRFTPQTGFIIAKYRPELVREVYRNPENEKLFQ